MSNGRSGGVSDFLFEGRPPPSVTSWGESTEQMPKWLSDYTSGLIRRANIIASEPYIPYGGPRIAGFTPDEMAAFGITRDAAGAYQPYMDAAGSQLTGGLRQAGQFLGSGTQRFPGAVGAYMDPFIGNVLDRQRTVAQRGFEEQTLPALQDAFTRAGHFGSDRMMDLAGRATRDFQEGLNEQQLAALSGAYGQAADIFGQDQARMLQGAGIMGELGIQGAGALSQLGAEAQRLGLAGAGALEQVGRTQRGMGQRSLDLAYEDFLRQRDYPRSTIEWMSSVIRGLPFPTRTVTQQTGPADIYQPSGLSQLASILSAGAGAYDVFTRNRNQGQARGGLMRYAKGGRVSKKDPRLARAGVSGYNKPKRTPGARKSHVVVAKSGDQVKTIRFGQQGVKGAGKNPKSAKEKARRRSFKARHAKNIAKGPLSAAYWANKVKWKEGGKVEPWERKNPKPKGKRGALSASQKKEAKGRARKAGRPYPNLVDNMAAARS